MIKALMKDKVTLTVGPGSIVIISEGQFKALGDKAVAYKDEAREEEVLEVHEEPKEPEKVAKAPKEAPKASASKKTSGTKKTK